MAANQQNLRGLQIFARQAQERGQDPKSIIDFITTTEGNDPQIIAALNRNRQGGIKDDKSLSDLLQLPTNIGITKESFETEGILGGAARFLGPEKLGRAIGGVIATPFQARELEQLEEAGAITSQERELIQRRGTTSREVLGSVLQTGLSVALPGAGRALTSGRLGKVVFNNALVGSGFGFAGALAENKTTEEAVDDALIGAVLGGGLGVGGRALGFAARQIKSLPEALYSKIFKAVDKDINARWQSIANKQGINPTLAKELVDRNLKGSLENMGVFSMRKVSELEAQLQNAAKAIKGKPVNLGREKKGIIEGLKAIRQRFSKTVLTKNVQKANRLIKLAQKGKMSVKDSLELRRFFDKMRNNSSFKLDPNLSPVQQDLKLASDFLRKKLSNFSQVKNLVNEERIYISAIGDLLDESVRRRNARLFNLFDVLLLGGGSITGTAVQAGTLASVIRALQSPRALTGFAQIVERGVVRPAQRILERKLLDTRVGRAAGLTARQLLFGEIGESR